MKIAELIELIDGFAPYSAQAEYDNSGLCLGDPEEQIDAVLLTTDVTPEVVEEALDRGCNVILSHHPVIFGPLKAITPADGMRSEVLIKAIKADVALISAHTNLDACDGGLNDCGVRVRKAGRPHRALCRRRRKARPKGRGQHGRGRQRRRVVLSAHSAARRRARHRGSQT